MRKAKEMHRHLAGLKRYKAMTEDQIKHMVTRFLAWPLPDNFSPDGGVSFDPVGNKGTAHEYQHHPSGTNLLDHTQAETMIRYLLDGLPPDKAT